MTLRAWRQCAAAALTAFCLMLLTGCATGPLSRGSEFQSDMGLVLWRVVDPGDPPMDYLTVVSESTGKTHSLTRLRFGQEPSSKTFGGLLPAGRYQPGTLSGSKRLGNIVESFTAPLAAWTGKFDVAANRVTQLGTMVYLALPKTGTSANGAGKFVVALDPTPVPVDALLAARYPKLSGVVQGRSHLGWIDGTVPAPRVADLLNRIRQDVDAINQPTFVDGASLMATGPLGVVAKRRYGEQAQIVAAPTVQAITAWLILKDGRWLVGGEQGYLAVSANAGKSWQPVAGLTPEDLVLHLTQASDGRLLMVTDRDRDAVVFESAPGAMAWRELKRFPSAIPPFNQPLIAPRSRDHAASSLDRLLISTYPSNLHILDLRTGQWETRRTPQTLHAGIKISPDGYVIGMLNSQGIWGSEDYGKTWKRLESWLRTSEPHFLDRRRGMVLAAASGMMAQQKEPFRLRTTEDGGVTWKEGGEVLGSWFNELPSFGSDATGTLLYLKDGGRILLSRDQGRTWN